MSSAWTEKESLALMFNIIQQLNPNMDIKGWKDIAGRMVPFGKNENVCKKRWNAIRKMLANGNDSEDNSTKTKVDNPKRKRGKSDDGNGAATPAKKRTPKNKSQSAVPDDAESSKADEKEEE